MVKRRYYESIPPAEEGSREMPQSWNVRKVKKGIMLCLAIAAGVMMVSSLPRLVTFPSSDEMEAAYEQGSSIFRVHQAQRTADLASRSVNNLNEDAKTAKHHHGSFNVTDGCEATVMIVRHCEKGDIREHCALNGYQRALYLASLFGDGEERWPAPSYIFALSPGGRHNRRKMNFREIETVLPLANKAGVTIDDSFTLSHSYELVDDIHEGLQAGKVCGKLVLICWKHSEIGHLAHHLGCGPVQGCPTHYRGKNFDDIWQIKFVFRTLDHSNRKSLKLNHHPQWRVYGSVQPESFDPLALSKKLGDYPPGGKDRGGKWMDQVDHIPERGARGASEDWTPTRVGFGIDESPKNSAR